VWKIDGFALPRRILVHPPLPGPPESALVFYMCGARKCGANEWMGVLRRGLGPTLITNKIYNVGLVGLNGFVKDYHISQNTTTMLAQALPRNPPRPRPRPRER
jgi:hypothetical protein